MHDDPTSDTPLVNLYDLLESGGGVLYETRRPGGYPGVDVAHEQLKTTFAKLKHQIDQEIPSARHFSVDSPTLDPQWAGTPYRHSVCLQCSSWDFGENRYDVICDLTVDGGTIDAVCDGECAGKFEDPNNPLWYT